MVKEHAGKKSPHESKIHVSHKMYTSQGQCHSWGTALGGLEHTR